MRPHSSRSARRACSNASCCAAATVCPRPTNNTSLAVRTRGARQRRPETRDTRTRTRAAASMPTWTGSPAPTAAWTSPIHSKPPGRCAGNSSMLPGASSGRSILPPHGKTGRKVEARPRGGARPMQPILGCNGSRSRGEMTSWPPSSSSCSAKVAGNVRPSGPNVRRKTSQARSTLISRISMRTVSPGSTPSIASGPVTWLNCSRAACSRGRPAASCAYGSSVVSNSTTVPGGTRATGCASAAKAELRNVRAILTTSLILPSDRRPFRNRTITLVRRRGQEGTSTA